MINTINSWGNNFRADINWLNKLPEDESKILIFGNNNSYGDASIPLENQTINIENLNKDTYYLSPLFNLDKYMYDHKNMLYGIPGKNNVTLGGAVASDVHGKDGAIFESEDAKGRIFGTPFREYFIYRLGIYGDGLLPSQQPHGHVE